jgi:hypothetical protein
MDADYDYRSEVLDLRCKIAGLLVQRALLRLSLALKAYSPDQPRVPAGTAEGGQWTSGRGGGGTSDGQTSDDGTPLDVPVQLAGDVPQNDTPQIPEEKPPTSGERVGILGQLASGPSNWMYLLTLPQWLHAYLPSIISYNDPPRSLEELQQNVVHPQPGYQIHHVVEQASAEEDGFPRSQIDAPENLVRIPTMRHWAINGWYQRGNAIFDGLSPREYLRGRTWDERMQVGLDALEDFGVLRR